VMFEIGAAGTPSLATTGTAACYTAARQDPVSLGEPGIGGGMYQRQSHDWCPFFPDSARLVYARSA
jgi:hypothetical protein